MTLEDAWDALTALFTASTDALIATDSGVYRGEPAAGELRRGMSITVQPVGWDDFHYQLALRIYAPGDQDALDVQDTLVKTIDAVERVLKAQDVFEREGGEISWNENLNAFVALFVLECERQDL